MLELCQSIQNILEKFRPNNIFVGIIFTSVVGTSLCGKSFDGKGKSKGKALAEDKPGKSRGILSSSGSSMELDLS